MRKVDPDSDAISKLSPEQYRVTQLGATEPAGTGKYLHYQDPGIYVDIVSGELCSLRQTSMNRAADGQASPSPLSLRTSIN